MTEHHGLRSDAERNRTRILEAACDAFAAAALAEFGAGTPCKIVLGIGVAASCRRPSEAAP